MIIQALYDYYNILFNDPDIEIPKPGHSMAKVNFVALLSIEGELLDLIPLGKEKVEWEEVTVPEQKKRSSGIFPYFMCDNCKYVLGQNFDPHKTELTKDNFLAMKALHEKILQNVENEKSRALLKFFEKWSPDECLEHAIIKNRLELLKKRKGGNIVFKLDYHKGYLHQDSAISKAWSKYCAESEQGMISQCLVSGETELIERIHPSIKGVRDANSTGATLVGVNAKAFESYGKTQGFNSPIGKSVVFGYTTALNYLLSNKKHHMQIGNATTVFWAEDTSGFCEDLVFELCEPVPQTPTGTTVDAAGTVFVKDALNCLKEGRPIQDKAETTFYIMGISPNNARLAIRFWHTNHFGQLVNQIWQHHTDMQIVNLRQEVVPVSRLIAETIPKSSKKNEVSPLLSDALMQSVFTGRAYPQGFFNAIMNRIRADGDVNDIRAGIVKAFLKRNARLQHNEIKEGMITVSLNVQNPNVAYRLGRLFAVLEKAQKDAADGKLNSTIKDRYFGTASASPRAVFPVLLKLAQHHMSKADYGYISDLNIQEILQGVDEFPAHLDFEEQGLFILGYYHQREALYLKKDTKNKEV